MGTTIAELQGEVAGLIGVVKDLTKCTNYVNHVTQTISKMAQAVPTAPIADNTQGLCMSSMQLPSFGQDSVVQDNISKLIEQFTQQTLHLPAKTSMSLLEQQCVGDWPRSVLSIAKTTKGYEWKEAEEKLTFVSKGYVQNLANPKRTNAIDKQPS